MSSQKPLFTRGFLHVVVREVGLRRGPLWESSYLLQRNWLGFLTPPHCIAKSFLFPGVGNQVSFQIPAHYLLIYLCTGPLRTICLNLSLCGIITFLWWYRSSLGTRWPMDASQGPILSQHGVGVRHGGQGPNPTAWPQGGRGPLCNRRGPRHPREEAG